MGNKQVEGVITDYFNALLDEGSIENVTEEVKEELKEDAPVSNKLMDAESSARQAKSVEEKAEKLDTNTLAKSSVSEAHQDELAPVSDTSSSKTDLGKGALYNTQQAKPQSQAKTEISTSTANATSTTAYDDHKQRLEKMLQQVSALDTQTELKPKSKDASVQQEQVIETDLDVAIQQTMTEEAYSLLPPLSSEWLENGRPNWAQEQFDILLIEVNGLQLAVPLVALGQIQTMDEKLTPLFGQSDWFMGLQQSPMGHIKTVNTAKFVMPERYQNEHDYKYVVSINGLNWGLAVDCIHQPISIDPDTIRWRVNRSSRPWMAGMVKDHMCVLLDIPSMGELLQKQDKNHKETTGG